MSEKKSSERVQEFPGQHDDETVDFVFRQHPLVMRKQLVIGLGLIVLAVVPFDFPQIYSSTTVQQVVFDAMLVVLFGVLFYWFHRWVGWFYSVYVVTDQRIIEIKQKGFFNRSVSEWQLRNISGVNYEVGGFQAVIFGFGDIVAKGYPSDLSIKTVHHPSVIHQQLLDSVREHGGGAPPPGSMPAIGSTPPED
jgi:hypothetical protein